MNIYYIYYKKFLNLNRIKMNKKNALKLYLREINIFNLANMLPIMYFFTNTCSHNTIT